MRYLSGKENFMVYSLLDSYGKRACVLADKRIATQSLQR
jgi:hypothetical protein